MKFETGQWYMLNDDEIVYIVGVNPHPAEEWKYTVFAVNEDGDVYTFNARGEFLPDMPTHAFSINRHLFNCTGFDWVPTPNVQLEVDDSIPPAIKEWLGTLNTTWEYPHLYSDTFVHQVSMKLGGSKISIQPESRVTQFRVHDNQSIIFYVDPDGEIWQGDKNITWDNAALAECLRRWIEIQFPGLSTCRAF